MADFLSQFPSRINIAPSVQSNTATNVTLPSPTLDTQSKGMTATTSTTDDKAKRLTACLVCRKRKLKCDSARPKCASCTRLGHAWYALYDIFTNRQWLRRDKKKVWSKARICQET